MSCKVVVPIELSKKLNQSLCSKKRSGPLAAILTNNISVAKTLPRRYKSRRFQNQTNRALLVWNNSEVKITAKMSPDRATSIPQLNLAIIDWLAGRYDSAEDNLTKANTLITGKTLSKAPAKTIWQIDCNAFDS